jgi:hypothetical protein
VRGWGCWGVGQAPRRGGGEGAAAEPLTPCLTPPAPVAPLPAGPPDPTTLPLINGKWRLVYTSRPGSASPIQRTFTGVEAFSIFQQVDLAAPTPRVNNIVDFGERFGYLIVQAEASTESRPLAGFTPRAGEGLPFGIMGKSFTYPAARRNSRIDFQFDQAAFHFTFLPFTIPYPVPFRLLGDERKVGWAARRLGGWAAAAGRWRSGGARRAGLEPHPSMLLPPPRPVRTRAGLTPPT